MKKKFENIDDLTRFKINSLHDEDIEVNDNLIWGKIEEELDKKTKVRVLVWRRIAAAACVMLLLGGSFWLINESKVSESSTIKIPQPEVSRVPSLGKEYFQEKTRVTDIEQISYNRPKKKTVKEKRLELNVQQIENHKIFSIEAPEVAFKSIDLPQISPKMATTKMRVMHISEYQAQTSEVFIKPKIFYVQTDIQNIIKSQTPVIPYALANISN